MTDKLYSLVEQYLFLFDRKDIDKVLFKGIDISKLKEEEEINTEEIKEVLLKNVKDYVSKQLASGRINILFNRYIDRCTNGTLTPNNFEFFGSMILDSDYQLEYEDMEKLYSIKQVKEFIDKKPKNKVYLIQELVDYVAPNTLEDTEETQETYSKEFSSTDSFQMYVKDTSPYKKVLTPEEEIELFAKYQSATDPEEKKDLQDKLILYNQGLVRKLAFRYVGRGLDRNDLIDEGNIGLIRAVQKFDLSKKCKFSTFAIWWIRQAMTRAVYEKSNIIRIPTHAAEKLFSVARVRSKYLTECGCEPSIEELAELTGYSVTQIENILKCDMKLASLNKPIETGDDADSELGDFIPDEESESPDTFLANDEAHRNMEEAICRLATTNDTFAKRKEIVYRLRIGVEFYNEEVMLLLKKHNYPIKDHYTLEEIGQIYGVTRERIRQIEAKAKRQIKRWFKVENGNVVLRKDLFKGNK